jgi:dimethylargininase
MIGFIRTLGRPPLSCLSTRLSTRNAHNFAIARELPNSFVQALSAHHAPNEDAPFSLTLARKQHAHYIRVLRQHIPTISLPAIEEYPDCAFVEDTVVVIKNKAVITQPGHPTRRGEVVSIRVILQQLGLQITDMKQQSKHAFCDGGDVLYTGRHLFVGVSDRTNEAAVAVFQQVFPDEIVHAVAPVVQGKQVLHLKSVVTHLDDTTLLAPTGEVGDRILVAMDAERFGYTCIRVPDLLSCNAVVLNGHILAQDSGCLESKQLLQGAARERKMGLVFVDTSELAKKDAALTCCSVLVNA